MPLRYRDKTSINLTCFYYLARHTDNQDPTARYICIYDTAFDRDTMLQHHSTEYPITPQELTKEEKEDVYMRILREQNR